MPTCIPVTVVLSLALFLAVATAFAIPAAHGSRFFASQNLPFHALRQDGIERSGQTYDQCELQRNCKSNRGCFGVSSPSDPLSSGLPPCEAGNFDICICIPFDLQPCLTRKDCQKGEVCVRDIRDGNIFCASKAAELLLDFLQEIKLQPGETPSPLPTSSSPTPTSSRSPVPPSSSPTGPVPSSTPTASPAVASLPSQSPPTGQPGLSTTPDVSPEPKGPGLSFEDCETSRDCIRPRLCKVDVDGAEQLCNDQMDCFCAPPAGLRACTRSFECPRGERCAQNAESGDTFCISRRVVNSSDEWTDVGSLTPTPPAPGPSVPASTAPSSGPSTAATPTPSTSSSPSEDAEEVICIDVGALHEFRREELVFERDGWAFVLCDEQGSCATPGHMVSFEGRAMMMKTYCGRDGVGCVKQMMQVNSPRYKRKLVVKSKTEGLLYTVFAARYETLAEEGLLQLAIRSGL